VLALAGIVFTAFAAYGQNDFKRLVAYSSVNHMGFVLNVIAWPRGQWKILNTKQLASWRPTRGAADVRARPVGGGDVSPWSGVVYERAHTRDLNQLGGLWKVMPIYGGILLFSAMANLGLPGLAGFPAEFQVVSGSWPVFTFITALSMIGLLMTGAYVLKANPESAARPGQSRAAPSRRDADINRREIIAFGAAAGADAGRRHLSHVVDDRD